MRYTNGFYSSLAASIRDRLGLVESPPPLSFRDEVLRFFLAPLITERASYLASKSGGAVTEELMQNVREQYLARLRTALRVGVPGVYDLEDFDRLTKEQRLRIESPQSSAYLAVAFDRLLIDGELSKDDFQSLQSFAECLRRVRLDPEPETGYVARPLLPQKAARIASLLLWAVQRTAFDTLRDEYPPTGKKTEVHKRTQELLRELFVQLDDYARKVQAARPLVPLTQAEARFRVTVARCEGRVSLPLRAIPTAPLSGVEVEKHFVGRPDEEARRLARQIRHADGAILVTGYRGVGKSSFVNRVVNFHALGEQCEDPADGWLLVPISINLAKVSGVQNILRITLRAVHNALLSADDARPQPIPGAREKIPLPLRDEEEIVPLQEAHVRATWKVTMSRSNVSERKTEIGSSLGIDPGKILAPITGVEMGKFLSLGASRSNVSKLNRELSLLDYDENAAEEDLARLINRLAEPRPLRRAKGGPKVRIKLVFIFDELDKMNIELGLKPMIEGLKNLFLQQHAVFLLITSKKFYYDLLKDRAVEDALYSSYFSAIVHVPLLLAEQARLMVEDWVEWEGIGKLTETPNAESRLLEQLTRFLVYRSFGNPRDIIRELRQMQDWADTTERPYLTDRLSKLPEVPVFAALQEAIERVAAPRGYFTMAFDRQSSDGDVMLVSERLGGDEARLEQVRRGLYIFTEELINRQSLKLSDLMKKEPLTKKDDLPQEDTPLEKLRKDNFSLLSPEDVLQIMKRLGVQLMALNEHLLSDSSVKSFFPTTNIPRLFNYEPGPDGQGDVITVTNDFYQLTGRQATFAAAETETAAASPQTNIEQRLKEAEEYAEQGWAEKRTALSIIKQAGSTGLSDKLKKFLIEALTDAPDPNQRLVAAECLTTEILFSQKDLDLPALLQTQTDERIISVILRLLGGASDPAALARATDALLALFWTPAAAEGQKPAVKRMNDENTVDALTVLQSVADRNIVPDLLAWMCEAKPVEPVLSTALKALDALSMKFEVDQAATIFSDEKFLTYFTAREFVYSQVITGHDDMARPNALQAHLLHVLSGRETEFWEGLLRLPMLTSTASILSPVLSKAFAAGDPSVPKRLIEILAVKAEGLFTDTLTDSKLAVTFQQMPEIRERALWALSITLEEAREAKTLGPEELSRAEERLKKLRTAAAATPIVTVATPETLYDKITRRTDFTPLGATGLAGAGRFPTLTIQRVPLVEQPDFTARHGVALVLSAALLVSAYFVPGFGLPEGATLGLTILGRTLSLLICLFAVFLFLSLLVIPIWWQTPSGYAPKDALEVTSRPYGQKIFINGAELIYQNGAALILLPVLIWAYQKYIGPFDGSTGLRAFALYLPPVILLVYGLRPFTEIEEEVKKLSS